MLWMNDWQSEEALQMHEHHLDSYVHSLGEAGAPGGPSFGRIVSSREGGVGSHEFDTARLCALHAAAVLDYLGCSGLALATP